MYLCYVYQISPGEVQTCQSNMPDVQYMATTLHMSVNACLCCMCNNAIPAWAESNKNAMLLSEEPNCVFSL